MTWGHYVPKFHSRNFGVNEKQIARFDRKTGQKKVVSIESFCAQEDYFSFDKECLENLPPHLQWIDKDLIEQRLAKFIEGPISRTIKNIIEKKSLSSISKNKILELLQWLAWIFIASPTSLAIASIKDITDQFCQTDSSKLSNTERMGLFCDLHEKITPVFQCRGWLLQLIDSTHGCLLSSDRPVLLAGKSLQEPLHLQNQTILFPLSPSLLLVGNNNPVWGYASKPLTSTREAVLVSNILTLDQSHRFIFGADMADIDNLFKEISTESKT